MRCFSKSRGFFEASTSSSSTNAGTPENAVAAEIRSSAGRKDSRHDRTVSNGRPFSSGGVSIFTS